MPAEATDAALKLVGVSACYADQKILEHMDLFVARGEIYALLGANGAGKSTVLNVVLGFHRPSVGDVRVCGIDVVRDAAAARERMAYLPENVALYEHLTAVEYLHYMLALSGIRVDASGVDVALERVGFPASRMSSRCGAYSKGMKQKVALALAIARNAPLLLLDEPASGLDPVAASEFNKTLRTLRDAGSAILLVTHDLPTAAEFADRVGLLRQGRISEEFGASGVRLDLPTLAQRYSATA